MRLHCWWVAGAEFKLRTLRCREFASLDEESRWNHHFIFSWHWEHWEHTSGLEQQMTFMEAAAAVQLVDGIRQWLPTSSYCPLLHPVAVILEEILRLYLNLCFKWTNWLSRLLVNHCFDFLVTKRFDFQLSSSQVNSFLAPPPLFTTGNHSVSFNLLSKLTKPGETFFQGRRIFPHHEPFPLQQSKYLIVSYMFSFVNCFYSPSSTCG